MSIYKRIYKDVEDDRKEECSSFLSSPLLHANICQDSSTSNSDVDIPVMKEVTKEEVDKKVADIRIEVRVL